MRHKRLKLIAVLLSVIGLTGLQAQTMYVKEMSGTQTSFPLSNIRKMTFSKENITVQKTDNTIGAFALNELKFISFKNIVSAFDEQHLKEANPNLISYPNPVTELLNIDLTGKDYEDGMISILTIEGKVVQKLHELKSDIVTLNLSHLPEGIYLCRYNNQTEVTTLKIIKQ